MMGRLLTAAMLLVLAWGRAEAADLPASPLAVRDRPAPIARYDWSGSYFGATVGGAWGTFHPTTTTVFDPASYFASDSVLAIGAAGAQNIKSTNVTTGLEAGYNWQIANFVIGAEVDVQYFHLGNSARTTTIYPCCAPSTFTINTFAHTDWLVTLRPRLGITNDNWLFYITGGFAYTGLNNSSAFTDTFAAATNLRLSRRRSWVTPLEVE